MSAPPSDREWLDMIGAGFPVFQAGPGHLVVVGQLGHVQARCTCGWAGPDRSDDWHQVGLVCDDLAWHCQVEGLTAALAALGVTVDV